MSDVVRNAREYIAPVVERLGFELVDIEYKKIYEQNNLTVYIFKKGGVTIDDCALVNDALDSVLEENDITFGQSYILNISSPGLDREVVTNDDFRRSLDTELELIFINPLGKKKQTHGILTSYDKESVTLKQKNKEIKYDRNNLKVIRPYINFK
ncbi:MAG: ribosome maturation factor RimP [Clostridiales bacterium]|nr:ribosome maturation factor RimP [Clostridiales bacterium]